MKITDIIQKVQASEVERIMKKEWFSYLWVTDEAGEAFPEDYCNRTLFILRNMKPTEINEDILHVVVEVEDDYIYREIRIENIKGEPQGYLFRTWNEYLSMLKELPSNQTKSEISDTFNSLEEMYRKEFFTGPIKVKDKVQQFSLKEILGLKDE